MSRRLLLVDDEDAIREIAKVSLERVGDWEVVAVASGHAAVEAAQRDGAVDAVLLDVMMPGLDGPSTMRALRAGPLDDEIPFVFLTAKLQAADRKRLGEIGAAGVIAKPFDPMTLAAQLDRIVADTSARRHLGSERETVCAEFAELWSRKRDVMKARVEAIRAGVAELARGEIGPERLAATISAAHMLSGSLGTFGLRRGSELAKRLEAGLEAGEPAPQLEALSLELAELVADTQPIPSGNRNRCEGPAMCQGQATHSPKESPKCTTWPETPSARSSLC